MTKYYIIASIILFTTVFLFNNYSDDAKDQLAEFELGESSYTSGIDSDYLDNSHTKDYRDNNVGQSNKISTIQFVLRRISKQNQSLQKQLDKSEKKTKKIKIVLNNLSEKINTIPILKYTASEIRLPNNKLYLSSITPNIVKQCEEQLKQLYKQKNKQNNNSIVEKLEREVIDNQWTADIDSLLTSLISKNNLSGSDIKFVNCRTSICEIVIKHNDYKSLTDFNRNLPRNLKYNFLNDTDDNLTENFFILRTNSASLF
ncbi:MAG: hypothetical protein ACC657_14110 [Thiohalomonadales bacterium]